MTYYSVFLNQLSIRVVRYQPLKICSKSRKPAPKVAQRNAGQIPECSKSVYLHTPNLVT